MNFILTKAYRAATQSAALEARPALLKQQLNWIQQRNRKCGLIGKDSLPIEQLQPAEQCMEREIAARIVALQDRGKYDQSSVSKEAPTDDLHLCQSAKSALDRLICADPDLREADSAVIKAYQDAKAISSDPRAIEQEQNLWARALEQKCGLKGNDAGSLDDLPQAEPCMEAELTARLAALASSPTGISVRQPSASNGQPKAARLPETTASIELSSMSGTFQSFRFSTGENGITGTIICGAPSTYRRTAPLQRMSLAEEWVTKIVVDDNANSYRMFESDAWAAVLNNIRSSARPACARVLAAGKLMNSSNQPIHELSDVFEAVSQQLLFMAYSTAANGPWILQFNAPSVRKKIMSELAIQRWVEPAQLAKNPYFYEGVIVGMVVRFDHSMPQDDGVFALSSTKLFVTNLPASQFKENESVVLAGRVKGNKGVIITSGDEVLMPELEYVGFEKCSDACTALETPPPSDKQSYPMAKLQ